MRGNLIVPGDAAATAANIMAREGLFKAGFAADSIMALCDVALAVLLYVLLAPVSKTLALMAAAFRLTQTAVIGLNLVSYYSALLLLDGADYAAAFDPAELNALVALALDKHAHGYDLGLIFFGASCLVLGYLIVAIGLPAESGSAGWWRWRAWSTWREAMRCSWRPTSPRPSSRPTRSRWSAEVALCLWLLVRGVNVERWRERAARNERGLSSPCSCPKALAGSGALGALPESSRHARRAFVPARAASLLAVLLTSATFATTALAAGNDAVIDGVPSATACAELGFDASMRESPGVAPAGTVASSARAKPPIRHHRGAARGHGAGGRDSASLQRKPSAKSYADTIGVDTERYPHATSNPIKRGGGGPGFDLLHRRRHRLLRQRPPLPQRRDAAAARCGARRGDGQLLRLRLPEATIGRHAVRDPGDGDAVAVGGGARDRPHRPSGLRHRPRPPAAAQPGVPGGRLRLDGRPRPARPGAEGAERADRPVAPRGPGVARRLCRRRRRSAGADARHAEAQAPLRRRCAPGRRVDRRR